MASSGSNGDQSWPTWGQNWQWHDDQWKNGWWWQSQSNHTWWSTSGDAWWGQRGQGGQWQNGDVPMDEVLANDADAMIVSHVQSQKDEFWSSEEGTRVRTAKPSPFEVHQLTHHLWEDEHMMSHVKRMLAAFGAAKGAGKASIELLKAQMAEHDWQPGQVVSHRSVAFTICKHIMLQGWKGCCAPSSRDEVVTSELCYCFPKTSLMPLGCQHTKVALTSPRVREGYHVTLCYSCSTCIRCGGHCKTSVKVCTTKLINKFLKPPLCTCGPDALFGEWGHLAF